MKDKDPPLDRLRLEEIKQTGQATIAEIRGLAKELLQTQKDLEAQRLAWQVSEQQFVTTHEAGLRRELEFVKQKYGHIENDQGVAEGDILLIRLREFTLDLSSPYSPWIWAKVTQLNLSSRTARDWIKIRALPDQGWRCVELHLEPCDYRPDSIIRNKDERV